MTEEKKIKYYADKENIKMIYLLTQIELPLEYYDKIEALKAQLHASKKGIVMQALDLLYKKHIKED